MPLAGINPTFKKQVVLTVERDLPQSLMEVTRRLNVFVTKGLNNVVFSDIFVNKQNTVFTKLWYKY